MSDRTQDLKNLRAVATRCKNYTDAEIAKSEEKMKWYMGEYSVSTSDDNTIAYKKTVPTGATRAKIKSIGGMSYKCNNLKDMSYPTVAYYRNNNTTFISTTDTSTTRIRTESVPFKAVANKTYYLNNIPSGINFLGVAGFDSEQTSIPNAFTNSGKTFKTTSNDVEYIFFLFGGSGFDDTTKTLFNEMGIFESDTYEPYFTGIRDSVVTSVKSYGANLISTTDYTIGGDAYNATITITKELQVGTTYTLSYDSSISSNVTLTNATLVSASGYISRTYITFTPTDNNVVITFAGGSTSNNLRDKLNNMTWYMLNYGSTAIPYKAYRGLIDTYTIPSEIQALEGYGRGINENCYNVLDLDTKAFTDKDNMLDIGTLTYTKSASGLFQGMPPSDIKHPSANTQIPNLLSAIYTPISSRDIYGPQSSTPSPNMVMALAVLDYLFFNNTSYTDASEFKTAMNGVNLQYELATYETEDVSAYLPNNVIKVEAGGYLVFENQYGQAVPSNITYRIEVAK